MTLKVVGISIYSCHATVYVQQILLDARRFDIEEIAPVYSGSIRDTSNDHISFPQLCNSGIPRMVIDYVIACREVDS